MTINEIPSVFIVKIEKNKIPFQILSIKKISYSERSPYVEIYTSNSKDTLLLNSLICNGIFELGLYILMKSEHIVYHRFFLTITNSVGSFGGKYTCNKIKDEIIYNLTELGELKLKTEIIRNYDKVAECK